jgi:truncated hemoglobin YjbI
VRGGVVAALLATVVACSGSGTTPGSFPPSLYDKYGGAAGIRQIVDDVTAGLLSDPVEAPFFTVLGTSGHDSPERLKSCLRLQFTALFGGPATYPGRNDQGDMCSTMTGAHADLAITGPVFDRFVADLASALKADGVSDADVATLAPILTGLKTAIVTR